MRLELFPGGNAPAAGLRSAPFRPGHSVTTR